MRVEGNLGLISFYLLRMRDLNRARGRVSSSSAPLYLFTTSGNIFLETEAEKYLLEPYRCSKSQSSRPDLGWEMSQQGVSHSLPDAQGLQR